MSSRTKARAQELRRAGHSNEEIGAAVGITERQASRYTADVTAEMRAARNARIIELCAAGFTTRQVADMVLCSQNTVVLVSAEWREAERQRLLRSARAMRSHGRTYKEIGERLGMGESTVYNLLKEGK